MRIDNTVQVRYKDDPVLLDRVIQDLQKGLKRKLKWLDFAFGRAYKLIEHRPEGDKFVYPAMYNGKGEYISLLPNDNLGNFVWFDIFDPQQITQVVQTHPQYTFRGAMIFWYNLQSIYVDDSVLHTEEVKDEILRVLTTPGLLRDTGKLTIDNIYERFENLYDGYSLEKIYNNYTYSGEDIQGMDKQFFMYPYAGLRVEFTLVTRELCSRYIL